MPRSKTALGILFLVGMPVFFALSRDWSGLALVAAVYGVLFALVSLRKRANPHLDQEYVAKAQATIGEGETVLAASLMAPQDKTGALIWSILKSSFKGEIAGAVAGSTVGLGQAGMDVGGTIGMLHGMHTERRENAVAQGLTPVLLVAVTTNTIQLLDWPRPDQTMYVATSETSITPTKVLKVLDRSTTLATKDSVGLTTLLYLGNTATGESIALQCSASPVTADGKPTKAVLAALGVR
jgi:hypothetical protein